MSRLLRIGIIGCGRAAERIHAPSLARVGGTRLTAVADPRPDRTELLARGARGCRVYGSGEELLQSGCVDAVIVANPPSAHLATALRALGRDVSVLLEKPLATTTEGLEQLEGTAADSAGALMMGFNRRHWEPARRLRRLVSQSSGRETRARMWLTTDQRRWAAMDGASDPLENLAPHQLDLARYLFDREIQSVSARWISPDAIDMRITLVDDVIIEARAAHASRYEEWTRAELDGREYRLWSGSERVAPADGLLRLGLDIGDGLSRRMRRRAPPLRRSYEEQLRAFLASVRGERTPSPGLSDGIAAVRAVVAARRSAAAGAAEVPI